ncbi:hypothetical protein LN042_19730 [Kitasatospora sp. RB6PN24]|uniref:MAB_1171c family putative transporter n=1 Tax=Kitasatospora humi TaxID=2893891 RepID=UPI001E44DC76|nr:MAB_1171c family putative transporter [Kitasatospora humi]MCC9309289.1 hypothetical protein [Kitasatospora humi]
MSTLAVLQYAITALMWGMTAWRLPALWSNDSQRQSLWATYSCFAVALTLKLPPVKYLLEHLGIVDLSVLLKHIISIGAICSVLNFIVAVYGSGTSEDTGQLPLHVRVAHIVNRVAAKTAVLAVLAMTALFFFAVPRPSASRHFVNDHEGEVGATLYMLVFYLFLGAASAVSAYQWGSQSRRATNKLLRTGLVLLCSAMCLGVLYVTIRVSFLLVRVTGAQFPGGTDRMESITESIQVLLFLLFMLGATVPTGTALTTRVQAWRQLRRLWPLWHDLAESTPKVVLGVPTSRTRDLLALDALEVRLQRRAVEIRDAGLILRHYAPAGVADRADQYVRELGLTGYQASAAAEAYRLRAAIDAKASGAAAGPASAAVSDNSSADEVPWLLEVSSAYSRLPEQLATAA